MADPFTIYAPFTSLPDAELFAQLAPGASITSGPEGATVVAWPDVKVTFRAMAREQLGEHLQGLMGFVKKNGGSTALTIRVMHAIGVFVGTIEPAFDRDAGNKAFTLCAQLTSASTGFAFSGGTLYDGQGRDLLRDGLARPSAEDVARRAEVLLACAVRGLLEDDAGGADESAAEALRQEVLAWVADDEEREEASEPGEIAFLGAPIGRARPQERVDRIWAAEAACAMLWALGEYELPQFSTSEHPYQLAKKVGVRGEPALTSPALRSDEELEAMRVRLTAIHWRLVEHRLNPAKPVDFAEFAQRGGWLPVFSTDGLPLLENDLAIDGEPLSRVANAASARSIARERQRGILWVLGVHPIFSRVDAPT
jgi:hypothetical protein